MPDLREFVMVKNTIASNGLELNNAQTAETPPSVEVQYLLQQFYKLFVSSLIL
jgi:hypothetical protein